MASRTAELILKLTDKVSGPAGAIITGLNKVNSAVNGLNPATGKPSREFSLLTREMTRLNDAVHRVGAGISLPAGALAAWGSKVVYDMEDVLNEIEGRTFGKGTEIQLETGVKLDRKAFRQAVLDEVDLLNAETPLTGTQILDAWNQLVQAGLDFDQIKGVMPAALDFSIAGNIEPNQAVDDITNIATAMRLPLQTTKQAQESLRFLADVIGYTANETNADIVQLAESFKYAAPAAAALGVDTEHMAAMFAIMAKNGIKASEAGVAVRSMMVRMVRPTNIAVAALSKYGIDFADYLTGKRETTPEDIVTMLAAAGINAAPVTQAIGEILAKGLGPAQLREELTSAVVGGLGGGSAVDKGLISDVLNEALFGNGDTLDLERLISDMQAAGISTADFFRIFDVRQGARTLGLFSDDVGRWVENIQNNSDGFAAALRDTRMQGVVGAVNRFDAAMIELFQSVAESGVLDAATKAIEGVAGLLRDLGNIDPKWLEIGAYAIGALAVLGPLGLAISGLAALFTILLSPVRLLTAAVTELATLTLGGAAVAEATGAAAGGGLLGRLLGLAKWGGAAGAAAMVLAPQPLTMQSEQDWLRENANIDDHQIFPQAWPKGGKKRGRYNPTLLDSFVNVAPAFFDDMWKQLSGETAKSEEAGAAMGQGIQQGIAAQTPAVVGEVSSMMSQIRALTASGVTVPVRVSGSGIVPPGMPINGARAGGGGIWKDGLFLTGEKGPELIRAGGHGTVYSANDTRRLMAGARQAGGGSQVNHFHIHGSDPQAIARQIANVLDAQLQRSRGLSMEGRTDFG